MNNTFDLFLFGEKLQNYLNSSNDREAWAIRQKIEEEIQKLDHENLLDVASNFKEKEIRLTSNGVSEDRVRFLRTTIVNRVMVLHGRKDSNPSREKLTEFSKILGKNKETEILEIMREQLFKKTKVSVS